MGSNALRARIVRLAADFAVGLADAIEEAARSGAAAPGNDAGLRAKALAPVPTRDELRRARAALRGMR